LPKEILIDRQWTLLVNKTIMQQNRIKSPVQLAQELKIEASLLNFTAIWKKSLCNERPAASILAQMLPNRLQVATLAPRDETS